jgi:hypothetical protein
MWYWITLRSPVRGSAQPLPQSRAQIATIGNDNWELEPIIQQAASLTTW